MNVAEEAVTEELLPYKEWLTTIVPEQGLVAAATSCYGCQNKRRMQLPTVGKVINSITKTGTNNQLYYQLCNLLRIGVATMHTCYQTTITCDK